MGRYGVDLTVFGPYELPLKSFQYGNDKRMNDGACPTGETCEIELRIDALGAWRADVVRVGHMARIWRNTLSDPEDVTDEFGPPTSVDPNFAKARYVDWASWAAASTI
ncbi:hypothetical protein ACJ73_04992 [Blastomyces percursus]|uniref:Uncharacterized protein n=1 Tax=Blastomyces percursus TaxID=1658174 RepID=A0A1J9QTV1_9EURO|nr:hypothetical protein ACJ73_04992 [Blastomyces percursus]